MKKNKFVLSEMRRILTSLTRGLDLDVLTRGYGEERGVPISYQAQSPVLGLVLPSNSPASTRCGCRSSRCKSVWSSNRGRRSRGRRTGWPRRSFRPAFRAKRSRFIPAKGRSARPSSTSCERSLVFGGTPTVDRYRGNPKVQAHGPGFSKILLGDDQVDDWEKYLDVMVDSVFANSGRGCINCSGHLGQPSHARDRRCARASGWPAIRPLPAEHPEASLAAFTVPGVADAVSQAIDADLQAAGVEDVTPRYREGARGREGGQRAEYLLPTIVHCDISRPGHREEGIHVPFRDGGRVPAGARCSSAIGPTLVCSAITNDAAFRRELLDAVQSTG